LRVVTSRNYGVDGFDGRILQKSPELKEKVSVELAKALNRGALPKYFQKGRLVSLSKVMGKDVVKCNDIRPIVIKSHIAKICEKVILNKIYSGRGYLVTTG